MKVRFLRSAMLDMGEIRQYIAKDNPAAAKRLVHSIRKKTSQLNRRPFSERMIPETINTNFGELVDSNYRIMYQVSDKFVTIFAVYESHYTESQRH
ncbi:type II toxin-antitoxin system RelE/ParE family toxin [bacterium]|nr:type II toxin-antitoxin system RelE/ParE family toxin [bacterium]